MATTPELGLPIAAPKESDKLFLEFRTEVYDSMMILDKVVSEIKEVQEESYAASDADKVIQADFLQNDSSKADYIKNRPCYESIMEVTWNGDTSNSDAVGLSNMYMYGSLFVHELTGVPDEFSYVVMLQANDPYQSNVSKPYVLAWCSTSPFIYGECVDTDGETMITTIYSTSCDVRAYSFARPGADSWSLLGEYHCDGETKDDVDIFRLYETSVDWSSSNIVDVESGEKIATGTQPFQMYEGFEWYYVSDRHVPAENLSSLSYDFVIVDSYGVQDSFSESAENIIWSCDSDSTFIAAPYVLNITKAGVHMFTMNSMQFFLYFKKAGIYALCDSGIDGSRGYVSRMVFTHTKKLSHQYLPFHYIIPDMQAVDFSALDFSKYDEGDIVFVIMEG